MAGGVQPGSSLTFRQIELKCRICFIADVSRETLVSGFAMWTCAPGTADLLASVTLRRTDVTACPQTSDARPRKK